MPWRRSIGCIAQSVTPRQLDLSNVGGWRCLRAVDHLETHGSRVRKAPSLTGNGLVTGQ
jgi:hypothetical protein